MWTRENNKLASVPGRNQTFFHCFQFFWLSESYVPGGRGEWKEFSLASTGVEWPRDREEKQAMLCAQEQLREQAVHLCVWGNQSSFENIKMFK